MREFPIKMHPHSHIRDTPPHKMDLGKVHLGPKLDHDQEMLALEPPVDAEGFRFVLGCWFVNYDQHIGDEHDHGWAVPNLSAGCAFVFYAAFQLQLLAVLCINAIKNKQLLIRPAFASLRQLQAYPKQIVELLHQTFLIFQTNPNTLKQPAYPVPHRLRRGSQLSIIDLLNIPLQITHHTLQHIDKHIMD